MSVKTCSAGGTVDDGGIQWNFSTSIRVGPTNVALLGDEDDATYIETIDSAPQDYMVRFNALTSYTSGDPILLRLRWSLESDGFVGTGGSIYAFLQYGHPNDVTSDYVVGQFCSSWGPAAALIGSYDGTIYESTLAFTPRPPSSGSGFGVAGTTLDEVLGYLTTGDCWLDVNQLTIFDAGFIRGRLFEAYLLVGTRVLTILPRRLYPAQHTRIWPPPTSPQVSTRFGSSAPL